LIAGAKHRAVVGAKSSEALREANTTRSRSMNKSSYFQGLLFSGHFGEHAWQAPFLEVV
jgi:hypothetical protein